MKDFLEKKIEETIHKIENKIKLPEIYNSLLSEVQVNEAFFVITQAQLRIARKKEKNEKIV